MFDLKYLFRCWGLVSDLDSCFHWIELLNRHTVKLILTWFK